MYIDDSVNHNQSLHRANRGLDDMMNTGINALENLRNQRERLKGAQRKVMDVLNSLGLSNTLMRVIERRTTEDRYIFYGLVAFSILFICLVCYLFL